MSEPAGDALIEREPDARTAYDFAILRVVPHVHLGAFVPVGVLLHARREGFLGLLALTNESRLRERVPGMDVGMLAKYLRTMERIASGDAHGGPIALAPTSERFHWLTAPRSDVLHASPVHEGLCDGDPERTLALLFGQYVSG
jgi:Protein of unknown function (DUF3037)